VALGLAFAACTPTPPSPLPSGTTSASPSPVATSSPVTARTAAPDTPPPTASAAPLETEPAGAAQCEPADVKASHGLVEGGAGSRFTTVVLVASIACSVDLFPSFGLRDANGAPLVSGTPGGAGRLDLDPDLTYESNVRLSNWCADEPAFPLAFELLLAGAEEEVTGATSFPEDGDVPPCNGETAGRILEASSWEAVP
jgi:hypothetical protein